MRTIRSYCLILFLAMVSGLCVAESVNVNTATAEQIADGMTGVGIKKAEAIVKDREANGAFTSLDDMSRVKGIGVATIDKNRENITLK